MKTKNARAVLLVIAMTLGVFCFLPHSAHAHVGYVVDHDAFVQNEGADTGFLLSGITQAPAATAVAIGISVAIVAFVLFYRSRPKVKHFLVGVREKLASYGELIPWMARLSLGIALIGAGTADVFISPVLAGTPHIGLLEILLGFFFLAGFLLTPVFLVTIGLFIAGLFKTTYLIGNFDFLALTIALFLCASGRPGIDDLLGIGQLEASARAKKLIPLVLRIGLGIAFIFLAVYEKFMNPHDSELVVTMYNLTHVVPVPPALWVFGAGAVEFVLGVLLILGLEVRLVSIVAFIVISLSFFYFKESVYSHVTLFGALSMLITLGAGQYSLDHYLRRHKN